jgi:hypothetical protein
MKVLLFLNPIGILMFIYKKNQNFEQNQHLKTILPFNQNIQIIELSQ